MKPLPAVMAFMAVMAVVTACDGDGATTAAPPVAETSRFLGRWSVVSGVQRIDCPTLGASASAPVADDVRWSAGSGADLTQAVPGLPCWIDADVRGGTAVGRAGVCSFTTDWGPGEHSVSSYTFTLSADGSTAEEVFVGSSTLAVERREETCAIERTAVYRHRSR